MFDFGVGYSELFVLAVVAVIVIGPKDLPRVLRMFGQFMNRVRGYAREFQGHVDAAMRESGADSLKRDVQELRSSLSTSMSSPSPTTAKPAATTTSAANMMTPDIGGLVSGQRSALARDFDAYFGSDAKQGETRIAGNLLVGSEPGA